jgi:menaquinone-dependent protoporphyrinogen oxidase
MGLQVEVQPVNNVRETGTYRAVIIGAAVYVGKWPKEAVKFLQTNETSLASQPVWLFSSGPTGQGDPVQLLDGWRIPEDVKPLASRIHPKGITVFHGFINPEKVNLIEAWAVKNLVKKPMGDFRDWKAITNWASQIAETLRLVEP